MQFETAAARQNATQLISQSSPCRGRDSNKAKINKPVLPFFISLEIVIYSFHIYRIPIYLNPAYQARNIFQLITKQKRATFQWPF